MNYKATNETGFVVDINEEATLTQYIVYLVENPAIRRAFGENGYAAIQNFNTTKMVERYQHLYRQLLKAH